MGDPQGDATRELCQNICLFYKLKIIKILRALLVPATHS